MNDRVGTTKTIKCPCGFKVPADLTDILENHIEFRHPEWVR